MPFLHYCTSGFIWRCSPVWSRQELYYNQFLSLNRADFLFYFSVDVYSLWRWFGSFFITKKRESCMSFFHIVFVKCVLLIWLTVRKCHFFLKDKSGRQRMRLEDLKIRFKHLVWLRWVMSEFLPRGSTLKRRTHSLFVSKMDFIGAKSRNVHIYYSLHPYTNPRGLM